MLIVTSIGIGGNLNQRHRYQGIKISAAFIFSNMHVSDMAAAFGDEPHCGSVDPVLIVEALAPGQWRYVTIFVHALVFDEPQALPQ
jgi:hypothetical protein